MKNEINGKTFFSMVSGLLDERTTRLVAAAAALGMKYGGISQVSRLSEVSRPSIYAGIKELRSETMAIEKDKRSDSGKLAEDAKALTATHRKYWENWKVLLSHMNVEIRNLLCAGPAGVCVN